MTTCRVPSVCLDSRFCFTFSVWLIRNPGSSEGKCPFSKKCQLALGLWNTMILEHVTGFLQSIDVNGIFMYMAARFQPHSFKESGWQVPLIPLSYCRPHVAIYVVPEGLWALRGHILGSSVSCRRKQRPQMGQWHIGYS